MKHLRPRIIGAMLCVFCATAVYSQRPEPSGAAPQPVAVPKLVRFSGSFRPASGTAAQAMESVTLSLYRDQTGGDALWHEVQNVVVGSDGHYSVLMGAAQNEGMPLDLFASGEPRWLGVQFNRPGEAEQPRVLLVSVPYALKAADSDTLGGRPASAYLLAPPAPSVGTDAASVAGLTAGSTSTKTGAKPKGTPANSGQPNYIGKFTNTTDLVDSAMYEVSGNVGIFTTTPAISLDVRTGTLPQMGIAGTTDYLTFFASDKFGPAIYWDPGKDMRFGKGGSGLYNPFGFVEQMRIQSSTGDVGIGTMTPGSKLQVDSAAVGAAAIQGNATATSGSTNGVGGQTPSPNGTGVGGINSATAGGTGGTFLSFATSGNSNGVYGSANSPNGNGVFGTNNATTGPANGVYGQSSSTNGSGVDGNALATSGFANGVHGSTASADGNGVIGVNNSTTGGTGVTGNANAASGNSNGVLGAVSSPSGNGVFGINNATTGFAAGVNGLTHSTNGTAVNGVNQATTGGNGGNFTSNATSGYANGILGITNSPNGNGVLGFNNATSGYAVGVNGGTNSPNGPAVLGVNNAASGGTGAWGQAGSGGVGVLGVNQVCNGSGCTIVNGIAGQFITGAGGKVLQGNGGSFGNQVFYVDGAGNGYFAGNLNVTGNLTKGSGSFKIDHPLDPANKYLSHSFVESPDMMDVYNGMTRLDGKGEAWVTLPDYFQALNGDFRYQLTAVGAPAPRLYVAQEVSRNRFKIAGGRAGGRVSWQVTGIRHDAYANAHRIPVTEEKPSAEQGSYLHPDVVTSH